jgi:hypothetical protein
VYASETIQSSLPVYSSEPVQVQYGYFYDSAAAQPAYGLAGSSPSDQSAGSAYDVSQSAGSAYDVSQSPAVYAAPQQPTSPPVVVYKSKLKFPSPPAESAPPPPPPPSRPDVDQVPRSEVSINVDDVVDLRGNTASPLVSEAPPPLEELRIEQEQPAAPPASAEEDAAAAVPEFIPTTIPPAAAVAVGEQDVVTPIPVGDAESQENISGAAEAAEGDKDDAADAVG